MGLGNKRRKEGRVGNKRREEGRVQAVGRDVGWIHDENLGW